MSSFDPRITPARHDLAAAHLAGKVSAARFVEGRVMHVAVELTNLHRAPAHDAPVDSQVLFGETVMLYDTKDGWGWVQLAGDHYVGYVAMSAIADGEAQPTHRVTANRTFIYPRPDIKAPVLAALPLGANVEVTGAEGNFAKLASGGFVIALHLMRADEFAHDFVAIAEGFRGTPYLWGGKSCLGIDCSGLVQITLAQVGFDTPRDTDLQQAAIGTSLPLKAIEGGLQRGDLIYWKGHVGIMRDADTLLHANAHHMLVASEPLAAPRARILSKTGDDITAIKRV